MPLSRPFVPGQSEEFRITLVDGSSPLHAIGRSIASDAGAWGPSRRYKLKRSARSRCWDRTISRFLTSGYG